MSPLIVRVSELMGELPARRALLFTLSDDRLAEEEHVVDAVMLAPSWTMTSRVLRGRGRGGGPNGLESFLGSMRAVRPRVAVFCGAEGFLKRDLLIRPKETIERPGWRVGKAKVAAAPCCTRKKSPCYVS